MKNSWGSWGCLGQRKGSGERLSISTWKEVVNRWGLVSSSKYKVIRGSSLQWHQGMFWLDSNGILACIIQCGQDSGHCTCTVLRLHLECCTQFWVSCFKKDSEVLDHVQQKARKLVKGLEIRKNFLVDKDWNRLPKEVVESPLLELVEKWLDVSVMV